MKVVTASLSYLDAHARRLVPIEAVRIMPLRIRHAFHSRVRESELPKNNPLL